MAVTIDEVLKIIKDGRIVATIIKGNNEDDTKFNQENIEALNTIVVTMHKYQKIEEIVKAWNDMNSFDSMVQISEVVDNGNGNIVKAKLLYALSKESTMVISTAYAYAKNYVNYGVDITKAWDTATEQASIIQEVREKVWAEAYDYFKKEYENRLKADIVAMFKELQLEIEKTVKEEEPIDKK